MSWPFVRKCLGWLLLLAGAALIYLMGVVWYWAGPGGSGTLASLKLPDGSEYTVTQRCNWSSEPYTVDFWMRGPGEPRGWCYIDHEALRWRDVQMVYNPWGDQIVVTERGVRRAVLDRKRKMFWIRNDSFSRELAAPQMLR